MSLSSGGGRPWPAGNEGPVCEDEWPALRSRKVASQSRDGAGGQNIGNRKRSMYLQTRDDASVSALIPIGS